MQPSIELLKEIIVPYERLPLRIFYFHGKKSTIGYPLHTHRDAELLFCIHGSLDIKIKETTYHLKKEDYLYINPQEPHARSALFKTKFLSCRFLKILSVISVMILTLESRMKQCWKKKKESLSLKE